MFGYLMLAYGTIVLGHSLGMVIFDKINDYQSKKRLEKALKEPITAKVILIGQEKKTIGYVSDNKDFQKLLKQHLTK